MKIDHASVYHSYTVGRWDNGFVFSSLAIDSRSVTQGTLFAAHKGLTVDAHIYINAAVAAGAQAIIAEYEPHDFTGTVPMLITDDVPRTLLGICSQLRHARPEQYIVAVTGSNGKTTTKDICAHILSAHSATGSTQGNLNTEWGVPCSYINNYDKDTVVLEMGMDHPGDIGRLARAVKPNVGIVTTIAPVHMEFMHSIEAIYEGKTELFAFVREEGLKLANGDNEWLQHVKEHYPDTELFGQSDTVTHRFSYTRIETDFTEFTYNKKRYRLPLWGDFNVYNAIPAVIIALRVGLSAETIQKALSTLKVSPKRAEVHTLQGKILINDTYNASPNAMLEALRNCARYGDKRVALCLGDMLELGVESGSFHREVLKTALDTGADVYCVGQEFFALRDDFSEFKFYMDKEECIRDMERAMVNYDVMFFKGSRGMRMEDVFTRIKEKVSCFTIS